MFHDAYHSDEVIQILLCRVLKGHLTLYKPMVSPRGYTFLALVDEREMSGRDDGELRFLFKKSPYEMDVQDRAHNPLEMRC